MLDCPFKGNVSQQKCSRQVRPCGCTTYTVLYSVHCTILYIVIESWVAVVKINLILLGKLKVVDYADTRMTTRTSTVNFEGPSLTLTDQSSEIVVDYADTSQNEQSEDKKVSEVVFVLFVSDQGGVYIEYNALFEIVSIRQAGL